MEADGGGGAAAVAPPPSEDEEQGVGVGRTRTKNEQAVTPQEEDGGPVVRAEAMEADGGGGGDGAAAVVVEEEQGVDRRTTELQEELQVATRQEDDMAGTDGGDGAAAVVVSEEQGVSLDRPTTENQEVATPQEEDGDPLQEAVPTADDPSEEELDRRIRADLELAIHNEEDFWNMVADGGGAGAGGAPADGGAAAVGATAVADPSAEPGTEQVLIPAVQAPPLSSSSEEPGLLQVVIPAGQAPPSQGAAAAVEPPVEPGLQVLTPQEDGAPSLSSSEEEQGVGLPSISSSVGIELQSLSSLVGVELQLAPEPQLAPASPTFSSESSTSEADEEGPDDEVFSRMLLRRLSVRRTSLRSDGEAEMDAADLWATVQGSEAVQISHPHPTVTMTKLLKALCLAAKETLGCDVATLYLAVDGGVLEPRDSTDAAVLGAAGRVRPSQGILGAAMSEWETKRRCIIIDDAHDHPKFERRFDALANYTTRSVLCVPFEGGALHLLNRHHEDHHHVVADEDLHADDTRLHAHDPELIELRPGVLESTALIGEFDSEDVRKATKFADVTSRLIATARKLAEAARAQALTHSNRRRSLELERQRCSRLTSFNRRESTRTSTLGESSSTRSALGDQIEEMEQSIASVREVQARVEEEEEEEDPLSLLMAAVQHEDWASEVGKWGEADMWDEDNTGTAFARGYLSRRRVRRVREATDDVGTAVARGYLVRRQRNLVGGSGIRELSKRSVTTPITGNAKKKKTKRQKSWDSMEEAKAEAKAPIPQKQRHNSWAGKTQGSLDAFPQMLPQTLPPIVAADDQPDAASVRVELSPVLPPSNREASGSTTEELSSSSKKALEDDGDSDSWRLRDAKAVADSARRVMMFAQPSPPTGRRPSLSASSPRYGALAKKSSKSLGRRTSFER